MLQRHDVLSSGIKIDRDWWYTTKLVAVIVISAAAAFAVIATLLRKTGRPSPWGGPDRSRPKGLRRRRRSPPSPPSASAAGRTSRCAGMRPPPGPG